MRLGYYAALEKPRDLGLFECLKIGSKVNGHLVEPLHINMNEEALFNYDLPILFGVKAQKAIKRLAAAGKPYLYFDKAYNRKPNWYRVSYCGHHPTQFLYYMKMGPDRYHEELIKGRFPKLRDWQSNKDGHIVFAGSSEKYHSLYGLPHPTDYAENVITKIVEQTGKRVVYRPKKSWKEAVPVKGSVYSKNKSIYDDLEGAYAFVTHGSNACFEALNAGIPAVILGSAVTRPISSVDVFKLTGKGPRKASKKDRIQLLSNLAYLQWSLGEIRLGHIWKVIDELIQIQIRKTLHTSA